MSFELIHPRTQLVSIMHRIYQNGMTTLSGGNLSIRETTGDIWITPTGVDKGKLTAKDIVRVDREGTLYGAHKPSSELPFHRAIYAARPDFNAIVHAHPPALVAFSIARKIPDTRIIPQAQHVCGAIGYAPYALPGSEALGEVIAKTFAEGFNIVLLENHGVVTGGSHLLEAFQRLETLDFCARTLIKAQQLGAIQTLSAEQFDSFEYTSNRLPEFQAEGYSTYELELRQLIVEIVHRACDRYLMISTEGVVSARVDEDSFIITPTGVDRHSLDLGDIVQIRKMKREAGKLPSRSVYLHNAIYERHKDINCIMTAQCPNVAAFAITNVPLDTHTIPESYILLRNIPTVPYGAQYKNPDQIAEMLSPNLPVVLIENDCILVTGKDILQAFDRLEVAEFSAGALIDVQKIGRLVPIQPEEIRQLEEKFLSPA